jgi:two-component system nitrate/nitrite response regulator NarL
MRILLVDDERLLLASVTHGLRAQRPDWVVDTASNGVEALACLKSHPVDILVTDIMMPDMDGMTLLKQIRQDPDLARLPLIFISGLDDRTSVRSGMASGADDYLTKPFSVEELIQAVESRHQRIEQGADLSALAVSLQAELKANLTDREWEVLRLVAKGMVTKDIAVTLDLSPRTVSVHRQNIMEKLNLHNAAALASMATRAGLA